MATEEGLKRLAEPLVVYDHAENGEEHHNEPDEDKLLVVFAVIEKRYEHNHHPRNVVIRVDVH